MREALQQNRPPSRARARPSRRTEPKLHSSAVTQRGLDHRSPSSEATRIPEQLWGVPFN